MRPRGDLLLLSTRKGLFVLERGKTGWKPASASHLGIPVSYAFLDRRRGRRGRLWAALSHGHWGPKLQRSDDLGAKWREVKLPGYPKGEVQRGGKPATLSYVWTMAPGGADQPERLYLGTEPGGLFASDDGGRRFHLVRGLWDHPTRLAGDGGKDEDFHGWFGAGKDEPGLHSIVVDPRDSDRVWIAISSAGVFETADGGGKWTVRNKGLTSPYLPSPPPKVGFDPHFVTTCAAKPDVLWMQSHSGVFRSTNGGKQWKDVSQKRGPVGFGFPICADEEDPRTAWVLPADSDMKRMAIGGALAVSRTEDGGKTWKRLAKGLPQEGCYDLVLRHGFDVAGERLAFGSTSGNVYASEDRGDSWVSLGHHFPPIYSVRFA